MVGSRYTRCVLLRNNQKCGVLTKEDEVLYAIKKVPINYATRNIREVGGGGKNNFPLSKT